LFEVVPKLNFQFRVQLKDIVLGRLKSLGNNGTELESMSTMNRESE